MQDKVSGMSYWEESYATIVDRDQDGKPTKIVGTSQRVDERKELMASLVAARNKAEESDRLKTTAALLNSLGGKVKELPEGLEITGVPALRGAAVDGCNDHRIVMAAATCAANLQGEITCSDAWSVNKSFPDFYEVYGKINGKWIMDNL